jgi:hypothetical protein
MLLITACTGPTSLLGLPTPTPQILADSFFYGCAYVDANDNGEIDEDDPGLKDAMFLVSTNNGAGFGARTSSSGCATVVVPGGLDDDAWPVTVRMNPPEDSSYTPVGPAEVVLARPKSHADFLFTEE